MRKSPFLLFPEDFPALDFRCTTVWRNLLRRLLRLLPFCGTIVFDNAYPYLWFVRRAFGSPDIMQRAGLSIRNLVGVFWRMILFPTDSDGGDGYSRCRRGGQCGVFWVWRSRSSGRSGGVSAGSGIVGSVPYPEPALACSEKRNVFVKPSAEPNLFRLCRGGKTTVENKRRMKFNLFGKRERKPSADYAGAEKER